MDIENETTTPTKKFRSIVDFVCKHVDFSYMASMQILKSRKPLLAGMAYKKDPRRGCRSTESLVRIWLPDQNIPQLYPKISQYVQEVPAIRLNSWEEEWLVVISHEMAHVQDFWNETFQDTEQGRYDAEVAAESFAVKLLGLYRAQQTKKRCRGSKTIDIAV